MRAGVILYGPPGCGKDTVTRRLEEKDPRFLLHRQLKVGAPVTSNSTPRYRMSTKAELQTLHEAGQVLYSNEQYGNRYAFVINQLEEDLSRGIPILHLGQIAGVRAIKTYPIRWYSAALWCSRDVAAKRLQERGSVDVAQRLLVWDKTVQDFLTAQDLDFDITIDTEQSSATATAELLSQQIESHIPD